MIGVRKRKRQPSKVSCFVEPVPSHGGRAERERPAHNAAGGCGWILANEILRIEARIWSSKRAGYHVKRLGFTL